MVLVASVNQQSFILPFQTLLIITDSPTKFSVAASVISGHFDIFAESVFQNFVYGTDSIQLSCLQLDQHL